MRWMAHVLLCGCLGGSFFQTLSAVAQESAAAPGPEAAQPSEAFRAALERLKSPKAAERAAAADEMGRRGHRVRHEAAKVLRPLLKSDPDSVVRAAAGRALGRLGVSEALPELMLALDDRSADVRVVAAAALLRLPDTLAVDPLLRHAKDSEAAVREWVAQALGVIGDSRATDAMIALLGDPERAVRVAAVLSLGRIGDEKGLEPLLKYLQTGSRDEEEKEEVVNSIARLKTPEKVGGLFRLLEASASDLTQQVRVVGAVGQVGDAAAAARLDSYTQAKVPALRKAVNEALAEIKKRTSGEKAPGAAKAQ